MFAVLLRTGMRTVQDCFYQSFTSGLLIPALKGLIITVLYLKGVSLVQTFFEIVILFYIRPVNLLLSSDLLVECEEL